ncbi:MAG: lipoyl synthase [Candidatus Hydrogenedentota bacterium]
MQKTGHQTHDNSTPHRFPSWIRRSWPSGDSFREVKDLLAGATLHTVCQSAHCPNHAECWARRTATVMVLGNVCTRHCTYCAVNSGRAPAPDPQEPAEVAEAARRLGLKHMVITSVTRDDLPDQGAAHIAATIRAVKRVTPQTTIEVLVQDFNQDEASIATVLAAKPEVFSHNIETVERLFPAMRDRRFTYAGSLECLRIARRLAPDTIIKSAFMLGCGETTADVHATLADLYAAGCEAVSMGQYLQPTPKHRPVTAYISPEQFAACEQQAYAMGFAFAVAGPFVRSSYKSEALLEVPALRTRLEVRR